jgi:ankyrin repeat protein
LKAHGCREGYDDALHGAIDFGHEAMVKWLLANGATNLNVPNFAGKSPLTAALKSGHSGIVEMLRAHGALEAAQP